MRYRTAADARSALIAAAVFFAAAQVVFCIVADSRVPGVYDTEYADRLALLQARLAETPDRPLLLVIGSSRTVMNFRPEALPELRTPAGETVLPFNFSHYAAGPIMNCMQYRRLRDAGVKPRWLVLEVVPALLSQDKVVVVTSAMTARDLPLLSHYVPWPKLLSRFVTSRLVPWHTHRDKVLDHLAPSSAPPGSSSERGHLCLGPLGGDNARETLDDLPAESIRRQTAAVRDDYRERVHTLTVQETATRAYRETLAECREDGIPVVLLLTPEGGEFRGWYTAEGQRRVTEWCDEMRRQFGVSVIDARDWLPDEAFADLHHTLRGGTAAFTKRLADEVLVPLVGTTTAE